MKLFSQQELEKAFNALPDDIKSAITAENSGNDITAIAKNKNLHIDQAGILNQEIVFVMLGLVKTSEFEPRIRERLGLDAGKAKELTEAVNEQMFAPLRVSIMKMNRESDIDTLDTHPVAPIKSNPLMDRSEILSGIEDEPIVKPETKNQVGTMPIADKKLNTATVTAPQKVSIGGTKSSIDPYRESIE